MDLPIAAICTGLGLFLYFWLLIFLDGLLARLLGSSKGHIHYSREDRYCPDTIGESAVARPRAPAAISSTDIDITQESARDVK